MRNLWEKMFVKKNMPDADEPVDRNDDYSSHVVEHAPSAENEVIKKEEEGQEGEGNDEE